MAQLNSLIVTGDSRFLNDINGNLRGNADTATTATTATKATQDESGNNIKASYASSISISDHTITLKNKNGASLGTVTVPDSTTDNTKLPLAGGTMTGTLNCKANVYTDAYTGSLNMGNSNIYGVNAIYTADASESAGEGINFYRDTTHVDTLWMAGGDLLFVPNRALGTNTTKDDSQKVGRFTTNPTSGQIVVTDGTTGGMKSSGYTIAKSVPSNAVFTDHTYTFVSGKGYFTVTPSGGTAQNVSTIPDQIVVEGDNRNIEAIPNDYNDKIKFSGIKTNSKIGAPSSDTYSYVIGLRGWNDNSGGRAHELAFNNTGIYDRTSNNDNTGWNSWHKIAKTTDINNASLNLQLGGTTKKTFTANASSNVNANFVFTAGTTPSTVTKKTVVTSATFNTVVTSATFNTVVTSATVEDKKLTILTGASGSRTTGASGSRTTGDSVTVTAGTAPSLAIS